jgi:hypothetical protein
MSGSPVTRRLFVLVLALVFGGVCSAMAAPAAGKGLLAPHRAIYDVKLVKSHGARNIESVRGRIVYDFSGNACDGYGLQFRQVSELASGRGSSVLSDLRSKTWENGAATKFRFSSENWLNEERAEAVEGHAERTAKGVTVTLSKPEAATFTLPRTTVFPTEHMRRIIVAAQNGKSILQFPVYDGSDNGQKLYDTLTVIGKRIAHGERPPDDAAAKIPDLAKLPRWPVTISYFERKDEQERRTGEQTPVYVITFELYQNGVSRALVLDYTDFTLRGAMTGFELKKSKPCE